MKLHDVMRYHKELWIRVSESFHLREEIPSLNDLKSELVVELYPDNILRNCFLCDYVKNNCEYCPCCKNVRDVSNCLNDLYAKCSNSWSLEDQELFERHAREIANLPVVNVEYIAIDFDGTIFTNEIHGIMKEGELPIGKPTELLTMLRENKKLNQVYILYTCREGIDLQNALDVCDRNGLIIDYVNENPCMPFKSRKPFANIYIDDRAILPHMYCEGRPFTFIKDLT